MLAKSIKIGKSLLLISFFISPAAQAGLLSPILGGGNQGSLLNLGVNLGLKADVTVRLFDNKDQHIQPNPQGSVPLNNVTIGNARYAGSGCPQGTASIGFSPDRKAISIIFDRYKAEAGKDANQATSMSECNLRIPINAPAGYRMVVAQLDYRGFYTLPKGAQGTFAATHQIKSNLLSALAPSVLSSKSFAGPTDDEFYLSATVEDKPFVNVNSVPIVGGILNPITQPILQPCGGPVVLDVQTRVSVQANQIGDQTVLTVDSVDGQVKEGVNFHLLWKKCK